MALGGDQGLDPKLAIRRRLISCHSVDFVCREQLGGEGSGSRRARFRSAYFQLSASTTSM